VPRFDLIRLIPGHEDERNPDLIENLQLARLRCEHPDCGGLVADGDKLWMTQRGIWVPACQTIAGRLNVDDAQEVAAAHFRIPHKDRFVPPIVGEKPITRNRGYWVDATVSPWRTVSQFLAKFFATKDNPKDFRVFHNSWKALPWKEATQSAEPTELQKHVEIGPPPDVVPAKATLLLGYADVQGYPMIRYTFAAFGPGEEGWVIKTGTCDSFEAFEELAFETAWPYADDETQTLACRAVGYDTGYKTSMVYERHRARPAEVFLTKGWETRNDKFEPARVEYYPSGKKNPVGVKLFHLNTGFYKEKIHTTFEKPPGGPGTLHLHRECKQGYLEELTSEHYVFRKGKKKTKGRWTWEPKVDGRPNHGLDQLVGLFFLADYFNARLLPTRETVQKSAARARDKTDRPTGGGYRKPDGRPWISGR
jgi:phage terminase large subunit GpA-like protein